MVLEKDVKKLILEELGVSDRVKKIVNEVYNDFAEHGFPEGRDNFSVKREFLGKTILFTFFIKKCEKKDEFINLNYSIEAYSMFKKTKGNIFINIYVPTFEGNFDKPSVVDRIFHEVNHVFQQISMNNEYGNRELYNIAAKYINSEDNVLKVIAWSLYITSVGELDSFTNGLYGFINSEMECGNVPVKLCKSDFFKKMDILEKCTEKISLWENNVDFIKALEHINEEYKEVSHKKFGITPEKLLKRNNFILKKMKRNIGRVITNVQNEIMSGSCRGIVFDKTWITSIFDFGK